MFRATRRGVQIPDKWQLESEQVVVIGGSAGKGYRADLFPETFFLGMGYIFWVVLGSLKWPNVCAGVF